MPSWIPGAGLLALIGMLYLAKAAIIRRRPGTSADGLLFAGLLLLAIPVTWALSDWNQTNFYPIMHWLGAPIGLLAVPAASFAMDRKSWERYGRPRSVWWHVLEFLVAVPVWFYVWTLFSFYGLGWGWI
jgi:hypothetical protein